MALAAGIRLGPYEIVNPLGAGGMGEVYKARDTRLERTVAIKVLPDQLSGQPDLRRRFEREARVISSLNHPHICTLYDVGHETGTDYLVMEYLEGETVAERLLRGPLPLDQALRIGVEVADALDKAHRQGIIHCDLKPGIVMLTRAGAKLLDFGIARLWRPPQLAADVTVQGRTTVLHTQALFLGTLQYMAPEQFEGKEPDPRSDIFAFGCLLYEMVTGRPAFAGANSLEVVAAIAGVGPAPPTTIDEKLPAALDHTLQQCLAKDPEERWQSARDLRNELRWIQQIPGAAAPPRSAGGRSLVWILAALGAVLAAGLVIASWRRPIPSAATPQSLVRYSLALSGDQSLDESIGYSLTLSPDGKRLAYVASRGSEQSIYIRSLDSL
ncbi:MAG: protein kinase domain-containing protein, partial [Terriglobales bacterium]